MALYSRLLAGDEKLEAAAVLDSAHVVQGAKGPHVQKLQLALVILDDADLATDGAYGQKTAAAVRAYKQKRRIVNNAYQASADDIVGKMTVVAMDRELMAHEQAPSRRARIEVIMPRKPVVIASHKPIFLGLTGLSGSLKAKSGETIDPIDFHKLFGPIGPTVSTHFLELAVGGTGVFRVENGKGAILSISDNRLAYVYDPNLQNAHGNYIAVYKDSLEFRVKALHPGSCSISVGFFASARKSPWMIDGLLLRIRFISDQLDFTPGVSHNHAPCNDWNKVKEHPNSSVVSSDTPEGGDGLVSVIGAPVIGGLVRNSKSPKEVVDKVLSYPFGPLARSHLNWYLKGGGKDYVEDENIKHWLYEDEGIRKKLARVIRSASSGSSNNIIRGHFSFAQSEYENDDYLNAWGAIDRVDYEADLLGRNLTVWFQDRYEWHPIYSGLYTNFPDDDIRPSNGLHAAFVEMKSEGAADYWMKGEYTVAMI